MTKIQQGATSAIVLNDKDEILFLKRSDDDDFQPGGWDMPGGGLEYGEKPENGVKREVKEETGLSIDIVKVLAANTYLMNGVHRLDITYLCTVKDSSELELSPEHVDYKWIKYENIDDLDLNDYIKRIYKSAKKDLVR